MNNSLRTRLRRVVAAVAVGLVGLWLAGCASGGHGDDMPGMNHGNGASAGHSEMPGMGHDTPARR